MLGPIAALEARLATLLASRLQCAPHFDWLFAVGKRPLLASDAGPFQFLMRTGSPGQAVRVVTPAVRNIAGEHMRNGVRGLGFSSALRRKKERKNWAANQQFKAWLAPL